MNQFRQRGKKLSPWTILTILARARKGERIVLLAQEYEINRATINRWILQWGDEARHVQPPESQQIQAQAN